MQFTSHTSHWLKKANIKIHSLVELHNNSTIFMQMVNLKPLEKKKNQDTESEDQQQNASMMQEKKKSSGNIFTAQYMTPATRFADGNKKV